MNVYIKNFFNVYETMNLQLIPDKVLVPKFNWKKNNATNNKKYLTFC